MANKIQIKRGSGAPGANVLDDGELGYDTTSKKLYVGNIDENGNAAAPTLINKIESVNSKTGAVVLKASDVEAVPTTRTINSKALSGDIELTYTDVKAAPEGYGLGVDPKTIAFSDADTTYRSGWYKFSSSFTVNGSTYNYGYMRVDAYNSTACTQTLYIISEYGFTFKRWRSNNNWSDWVEITHDVFAPAGYGLGSIDSQPIGGKDFNDIVENGWYWWNSTTQLNVPFTAGKMLVVARDGGKYCTQIAFDANKTTSIKVRSQGYDETWSAWVDWSPSAFAPAGYGLGVITYNATTVTSANDAYRNGWYRLYGEVINGKGVVATLRVEAYSSAYVVQTAYQHSTDKMITWRRYCLNGTWTEWEDVSFSNFPSIVKLWENNNYTSSFAAQTIQLANWEAFDMIEIIYNYSTDTPTTLSQRAPLSPYTTTIVSLIIVSGANNRCGTRRTNVNTDGSISFETAYYNEGTNNKYVVPVAVYGIKGVVDRVPEDNDQSSNM